MIDTSTIQRAVTWSHDSDVPRIGLVAGVTLLVDTVGRWLLTATVGAGMGPLALVVVLATIIVGSTARWGLVVGLLGSGLLVGDWTGGVVSAVAAVAAATLCTRLRGQRRDDSPIGWLVGYVVVAGLTAVTLVAITAWLSDLFGVAAFSIVVVQSLPSSVGLALLGAPIAWVAADVGPTTGSSADRERLSGWSLLLVFAVLVVWIGGGALGSFMYQAANTVPAPIFGLYLGSVAEQVVVLGGPQGRYAVTALSGVAVAALVAILRRG